MAGYITKVIYIGPNLAVQYDPQLSDSNKSFVQHFPYTKSDSVLILDTWEAVRTEVDVNGSANRWCIIAVSEDTPGTELYKNDIPPVPELEVAPHLVDLKIKAAIGANAATLLINLQDPEFYNFVQRYKQLTAAEIAADSDFKNMRDCSDCLRELSWP